MVLTDTKIIDGRDHLLGRLCSIVAKELLAGQKIVIVRCDEMCISGSCTYRSSTSSGGRCCWKNSTIIVSSLSSFPPVVRNKVKYAQFRRKRMNTNPRKGPFHFKSPSMIVWRTIRGMVHQKTARGQQALQRLTTYEGIPAPYDKQKRVVVPAALKVMRLKPNRDYTVVGELADAVGWKHKDLLQRLEAKRKAESSDFYAKKKSAIKKKADAAAACAGELTKVNAVLGKAGY